MINSLETQDIAATVMKLLPDLEEVSAEKFKVMSHLLLLQLCFNSKETALRKEVKIIGKGMQLHRDRTYRLGIDVRQKRAILV